MKSSRDPSNFLPSGYSMSNFAGSVGVYPSARASWRSSLGGSSFVSDCSVGSRSVMSFGDCLLFRT